MKNTKETVLCHLPECYRMPLSAVSFDGLEEIRFRAKRPILLYYNKATLLLGQNGIVRTPHLALCPTAHDLEMLAACLCNHSVYACLDDLSCGFVTITGGHRIGFSGRGVIKENCISSIASISGINLRIAREHCGCAESLASKLCSGNTVKNTLLISPPQCGKTTYLRDLARIFSARYKITIVDERSEIAGMQNGTPAFDIGLQTDVLDHFPKTEGMLLALRSLSPQILMTDELGDPRDNDAMMKLFGAGCKIIATLHGESLCEIKKTKKELLSFFDVAVLLGRKGGIPSVLSIETLG